MSELSPAAQAVLFAWDDVVGRRGDPTPTEKRALAAALQAAADQVVPEETWLGTEETCYAYYRQRCNTRAELLAIAAELRGQNQPSSDLL